MNEYTFSDIAVGMKESFSYPVTQEKQHMFTSLTGDVNPLHCNPEYANSIDNKVGSGHGVFVYGMLTASLFSTLAGVYLPGKYCLLQHIESTFITPVRISDILTVCGHVVEKDSTFKRIKIRVTIKNQNDERVCRGIIVAGVFR